MAKKVGKGIFIRSEPWQCYHAERNGYIYFISDKKNFTADKGWKIMQREGGREFVYVLMRQRKGFWQYKGEKAYENIFVKDHVREDIIFDSKKYEESFKRGNVDEKDITSYEDYIVLRFGIDDKKNLNLYVTGGADLNSYYIGIKTWTTENGKVRPIIRYVESIGEPHSTCKFGNVPMQFYSLNVAYETYRALVESSHNAFLIVTDNNIFTNELGEDDRHDYFILKNEKGETP